MNQQKSNWREISKLIIEGYDIKERRNPEKWVEKIHLHSMEMWILFVVKYHAYNAVLGMNEEAECGNKEKLERCEERYQLYLGKGDVKVLLTF